MKTLKIAIGSDHAGFFYKKQWIEKYQEKYLINDYGTYLNTSVDYPDFAHQVAKNLQKKNDDYGILLCGSGNGMAMTANKYKNIRAALCWNEEVAMFARKHNDANIFCVPTRFISFALFENMVNILFSTLFEKGRHEKRIEKMHLFLKK